MSSYDQNLLGEAPRATRAQLQEGYNVDLLEQPPRRTPSVRNPPPPQTPQPAPGAAETGSGEKFAPPAYTPPKPLTESRTSFWRSRKGVVTVVLIVLIAIGAVVGGAVGGTVKKGNSASVVTPPAKGATSSDSNLLSTSVSASATGTATGLGTGSDPGTQGVGGSSRPTVFTATSTIGAIPTLIVETTDKEAVAYRRWEGSIEY